MANENLKTAVDEMNERLKTIEDAVLHLVQRFDGIFIAESTKQKTKKSSKNEKEALKAELLSNIPYTENQLKKLGTRKMRSLGSALEINTFGMKTDKLIEGILKAQKKVNK